jgi:DNA polymerase-3 subunit gamma/tau
MSYQVLARKWRPRAFKDMVGQEHILRMLANALEQKRIHHAYLFTGTRGVGKTTLARILSKCLNCETGITPTPCGTCHTCRAIDAGHFLDLFEVDAASRTKVEDTRELLDNVMYPPTQGRYKIYLIDEVHMLSNHSFNALLKTLEEPPEHVKFLLATTDPKRLPITILSRCLQFHVKRITPEQIAKHLQHICGVENIANETPALDRLAKAADGSMRDALSLLDQAIAYGHGKVTRPDVTAMLGSMAQDDLLPLLDALALADGSRVFTLIGHLAERAPDFQQVLEELISIFHQIAVFQIVPDSIPDAEGIAALASRLSPQDVQLYYQIAMLGRRDLALAPSPQQGFEMTMIRMLAFQTDTATVTQIKPAVKTIKQVTQQTETSSTPALQKQAAEKTAAQPVASLSEWRDMLPKLELTGMAYALAANCTLQSINGNKVELALSASHAPMLNPKLKERLAEALSRYLNQPVQLEITATSAELVTPVKQQQEENKQQLAGAKQSIMQDPKVKQLIDMYDATVEVSIATS